MVDSIGVVGRTSRVPVSQNTTPVKVAHLCRDSSAQSSLALASVFIKANHNLPKNIILRSDLLDDIQETAHCSLP